MFKSKKSTQKTKFKALFQLHFQATQVPKLKRSSGLTVALIPEDVGKPTVKLQKAAVIEGICTWENPIYETVKLVADQSNGKIEEKIYYFVISSGSSKAGFLGEVSIDFAEYVEATTPWLVPLPLTESDSGPMLNVTIQRMPTDDDDKMFFKKEDVSQKLDSLDRSCDDSANDHVSLKLDSLDQKFENNGRASNTSVDGSKGSLDFQNGNNIGSFNDTSSSNKAVHLRATMASEQVPSPRLVHKNSIPTMSVANTKSTTRLAHQSSATDWSVDSFSDPNMSDAVNSPEYNYPHEALSERLSSFSDKLKSDGILKTRQVEILELELQTLRKQVVKETKKSQELSAKIVKLREERDIFERECGKLKSIRKVSHPQGENEVSISSVEELKKELTKEKYEKKKLCSQLHRAQDSNSELILVVRDLKKKLDQNNTELSHHPSNKENASSTNSDEDQEILKKSESEEELQSLKQKLEELYGDMDSVRNEKEELENDLRQLSMENRRLRKENRDFSSQLEQQKIQHAKMEHECMEAVSRVEDLESHIGMLRIENKKQSEAITESWDTITELEAHIGSLEQEVETQNTRFKEELEAMTRDKDALEQQAMKTEETLRKSKQNNAAAAENLQEEFTALSEEMALKLDESEKMATEAQRKLEKETREFLLVRSQYHEQLQELENQIDDKDKIIEKMSTELREKSQEFCNAAKLSEEKEEALSMQINMLKGDIEKLTKENNNYAEQAKQMRKLRDEMEDMKRTISENGILKKTWDTERSQLEERYKSANRQAEKFQEELNAISRLKDQKKKMISNLKSQEGKLRLECDELKSTLSKEKTDRQDLKLKLSQLKDELQKNKETIITMEIKLKENKTRNSESIAANGASTNNKSAMHPQASQEVSGLKKKVKMLEEQIKAKDAVIGNTTSSYEEKEKQFQTKIKDLESKARKLPCSEKELKGTPTGLANDGKSSAKAKAFVAQPTQGDDTILEELRTEMAQLKEKNKSMESELKDMEEKYSEISLKFAEVEGERQQLVMTVRNLKNGKRA